MFTIVETETFERLWPYYWTEQVHDEFISFITENFEVGDVVRGSGGACVIYFNQLAIGEIWLALIFSKNKQDSIDAKILKEIKYEIEKTID